MKKLFPWALILLGLILAVLLLRATDEARRPAPSTPRPTVPGLATVIFQEVNSGLAGRGLPTLTPGLDSTAMIGTAVQATLVTATPTVTETLLPTRTPIPGVGTQIFQQVQALQAGAGDLTSTPGVPLEVFIQQAAAGTATAIASQQP